MKLGLVGFGSVARQALQAIAAQAPGAIETLVCLARPGASARATDALEPLRGSVAHDVVVVESLDAFLAARPALVAEAAGHAALRDVAPACLAAGCDVLVTSAGALADDALRAALDAAARAGGARWSVCAGAVGGLDILAAAKLSGLEEVVYTSRKPPAAWLGTPAERVVDLARLTHPVVFYEGDAAQAARDYPQNANVAATIALAGAGFAATRVRLTADPGVARNVHELSVRSRAVDVTIQIAGHPSPDNPKTSLTTGFALAADVLARLPRRT